MRFKHEFAIWRPSELSAQVQPIIAVPKHGSYPMGHACEAVMTATLLAELINPGVPTDPHWLNIKEQLDRLAHRIGWNRIIAGVHYPYDMWAGMALGSWLGRYFLAACSGQPFSVDPVDFNVEAAHKTAQTGIYPSIADSHVKADEFGKLIFNDATALQTLFSAARGEWDNYLRNPPQPPKGPLV